MGLTLIQRSQGPPPRKPRIALVLAGGAITGGAFKMGGLQALDECLVGRGVTQFDTYVGLSAGSFLAVALAGGVKPAEMIAALDGRSDRLDPLSPFDFYRPNAREAFERVWDYGGICSATSPAWCESSGEPCPSCPGACGGPWPS